MKDRRGFSLLEVVIALAIMAMALMAIFRLNSGAVSMHTYTKKLTVASMLARSKMTDLEQDLFDKGFPGDDEERSGDFSSEGFGSYKWQAKILAPRTQNVSTNDVLSALLNIPAGAPGGGSDLFSQLFSGGGAAAGAPGDAGSGSLPGGAGGLAGAAGGMAAGMAQTQVSQFLSQIREAVREIRLTVSWKDGKRAESVDLVYDVVSAGPGSDRNGTVNASGLGSASNNPNDPLVNPRTGARVPNPVQGPSGPTDPTDPSAGTLVPLSVFQSGQGAQPAPNNNPGPKKP